ncbi:DUF4386 family protein [Marinomonas balearica]|uniref:Uncharacterized protein DUF4386 n=1 Tax=Marinomonas balearica TaxID=491947 RepID=A0A4R6MH55_9GAMM|nr:DUF4386 family protein [Marinomonas balearica]TDP01269.1 uncharacterized protein DUF4386 [Marinomonas balearica]
MFSGAEADNVMLLIQLNQFGELIWAIFFAYHGVVVVGVIVKSEFMPKILGSLLLIADLGYGLHGFGMISRLSLEFRVEPVTVVAATTGKLLFIFWL